MEKYLRMQIARCRDRPFVRAIRFQSCRPDAQCHRERIAFHVSPGDSQVDLIHSDETRRQAAPGSSKYTCTGSVSFNKTLRP